MHRVRAAVLAGVCLVVSAGTAGALDPQKSITQYAHQVWKTDAGLPQNSVQSILQTRDGYLWLGTERGLVRFDGVQFTVFDKGNTPGLQNSNVQVLFQGRDGGLWVGTWGGLHLFRDGRIQSWTTREGLSNNRVLSIAQDRNGAIWVGHGRRAESTREREGRPRTASARVSPTKASGRSRRIARAACGSPPTAED